MFNTMTLTKTAGGLIIALLFLLLGNWAASSLYATAPAAHGDEVHASGYEIAPQDAAHGADQAHDEPVEVSFADLLAAADPDAGAKVFSKCKACHKLEDGAKGTGPHLFGAYGRAVASVEGFGYSDVLAGLGGSWDADALNGFLTKPKDYAPGTKMTFAGLKSADDRANLIAYLATIGGDGLMMAPAAEPAAEEPAAAPAAEEPAAEEPAAEPAAAEPAEEPAAEEPAAEPAAEEQAAALAEAAEPVAVAGDVTAGEKVFKKCKACHKLESGAKAVGPDLVNIVGRAVASVEGFKYSDPMLALGGSWDAALLDQYLTKPKDLVPGTKMTFAGLRKEEDRANVIAYLATITE